MAQPQRLDFAELTTGMRFLAPDKVCVRRDATVRRARAAHNLQAPLPATLRGSNSQTP